MSQGRNSFTQGGYILPSSGAKLQSQWCWWCMYGDWLTHSDQPGLQVLPTSPFLFESTITHSRAISLAVHPSIPSIFWATHSPTLIPQQALAPWDRIRHHSPTLNEPQGCLPAVACALAPLSYRGLRGMRKSYEVVEMNGTERHREGERLRCRAINHLSTMCQTKDKNVSCNAWGTGLQG